MLLANLQPTFSKMILKSSVNVCFMKQIEYSFQICVNLFSYVLIKSVIYISTQNGEENTMNSQIENAQFKRHLRNTKCIKMGKGNNLKCVVVSGSIFISEKQK